MRNEQGAEEFRDHGEAAGSLNRRIPGDTCSPLGTTHRFLIEPQTECGAPLQQVVTDMGIYTCRMNALIDFDAIIRRYASRCRFGSSKGIRCLGPPCNGCAGWTSLCQARRELTALAISLRGPARSRCSENYGDSTCGARLGMLRGPRPRSHNDQRPRQGSRRTRSSVCRCVRDWYKRSSASFYGLGLEGIMASLSKRSSNI